MIRVKTIRKNGKVYGFLTEGHAMFDRYGKDVVCAAVSILTINTVNSFESFLPEEETVVNVDDKKGSIECFFKEEPSEKAKLLLDAYFLGISGIEKEYGKEYLKLEDF